MAGPNTIPDWAENAAMVSEDPWTETKAFNIYEAFRKGLLAQRPHKARASRTDINRTATAARDRQATVTADNVPIDIPYGRQRYGAKIFAVGKIGADLVLGAGFCLGEIEAFFSILMNGEAVPASVTVTQYKGTTAQGVDAALASAIPGYADDLVADVDGISVGIAYIVARIPPGASPGFPKFEAVIDGLRLYDPRGGGATAFSNNPALALADFLSSPVYGKGKAVNWASVEVAADACDEIVGAPGEKRRTVDLAISRVADTDAHVETLRTYAGCFVVERDGEVFLVPDRPGASARSFTAADILKGSLKLRKRGLMKSPTVVRVAYTDTTSKPWKDAEAMAQDPGVPLGTTPRREASIRLPGITRYSQAYREAVERLNYYNVIDLEGEFVTFDEGLALEQGDRFDITHPLGLNGKECRGVGDPVAVGPGRWKIPFEEYDPAVYSDSVQSEPTYPDTNLPDPTVVPGVTGLSLDEEVYQMQPGTFAARIRATWDAAAYPYSHRYRVTVETGGAVIAEIVVTGTEAVTPAIQEGNIYTVKVRVESFNGFNGEETADEITAIGKYLKPGPVPQITAEQISADTVRAVWAAAVDLDIYRYELRIGTTSNTWDDATPVDRTDKLELKIPKLTPGTYRIFIKPIDSVWQYSDDATTCDVAVAKPTAPASLDGFEVGGEVRLSWAAGSGFVKHYEIRYGSTGGTWSGATMLDRVDALRLLTKGIAEGTWRFYVRALDAAGNYSDDQATKDIAVTSDAGAYLADSYDFTNPSLTNMRSWSHRMDDDAVRYYVTDMGDSIASMFPNAMSTYAEPLATYHSSGSSELLTETKDFGGDLTGNWSAEVDASAVNGSVTKILELSNNGTDWDQYPSLTAKRTARYARIRIQTTTTSTALVTIPLLRVKVAVVPREESGSISCSATGTDTVTLSGVYSAVVSIVLTPEGTTDKTTTVDNIQTGDPTSFDVYLFAGGSRTTGTVRWTFKGV